MEASQLAHALVVLMSCLLLAAVTCDDSQDSALDDVLSSQPQKRSISGLPDDDSLYQALYPDSEDLDKRSTLFRFGKRGTLFRFGKRGTLFRFGKRGSLFRFGKRDGDLGDNWVLYRDDGLPVKREVKSFHWGRETDQ